MNHARVRAEGGIASTPLPTRVKWRAFRLLERLSDLRGNAAAGRMAADLPAKPENALWVFVSTIGELNAINAFLGQLVERLPRLTLVLITDHPHYRESYLARYPEAVVYVTLGHSDDAQTLAAHYPPRMLVVAEIPCLPSDAPCRFSFAFVLAAKRMQAPAIIVNGWLYHYAPACRMDSIERRLFARDYLRSFDVVCVQTKDSAQRLIAAGASAQSVSITGNIKFDGMRREGWSVEQARSPRLLASLLQSTRKIIVAGCVTSPDEQAMLMDAFEKVKDRHPSALLVIAPRHPEVASRMRALKELLDGRRLRACFRTAIDDSAIDAEVSCLVLDTMGDLRDFYAAGAVAHVGVDHNVLEPLGFGKPVTVIPGWDATYPSWPVYQTLKAQDAVLEASDAVELFRHWDAILSSNITAAEVVARAERVLQQERGAVDRHFAAIDGCLASLTGGAASRSIGPGPESGASSE